MRRLLLLVASCLMVSSCVTYSLEELRRATPTGTPFQKDLAQYYLDFANKCEKAYDWWNAIYFADKGLMAAYGKDTAPEVLAEWHLRADVLPDMEKARAALIETLTPEIIQAQPRQAARAQYLFDCWVKNQEQNWQADEIAYCRDGLIETLHQLGGADSGLAPYRDEAQIESTHFPRHSLPAEMDAPEPMEENSSEPVEASVPAEAPVAIAVPEPKAIMPTPKAQEAAAVVFFEAGSADMAHSGEVAVDQLIESLKDKKGYTIVLNGHTDGSEKEDLRLSQSRCEMVKDRLVAGGIEADAITIFAFGKSDPTFKASSHAPEPANRRVEIFLND